jgi:hypothetical protein
MTSQAQRPAKIGRNDPCYCGSGRKYKDCHRPIDEAARSEQLLLRQAQDTLLPKIIDAAQAAPERLPEAFARFWQGQHSLDNLAALDRAEDRGSERFLTWFAFDVRGEAGQTLVEQLAASEQFELDQYERRLIASWTGVRLRAYVVESVQKGSGVAVRDLLDDAAYTIADYGASKRLAPGEVIVGHLIPADTAPGANAPTYYLAGAAAQLTDDTAARLREFAELHLADLRRSAPDAEFADLIAQRSEILNHFVMALPVEHPDTSIMDRLLIDARASMQLTAESVAALLGRNAPAPEAPAPDERRDEA